MVDPVCEWRGSDKDHHFKNWARLTPNNLPSSATVKSNLECARKNTQERQQEYKKNTAKLALVQNAGHYTQVDSYL